jgi:hypothetical protein
MISFLFNLVVSKFGLGLVLSAALICAWWLVPPIPWLTDRLRTGLLIAGISVGVATIAYGKGRYDENIVYRTKIEREKADAIEKGDAARERALRDFDAAPDELPDDGFRRP